MSGLGLPLETQYAYLGCPTRRNNEEQVALWAIAHARGQQVTLSKKPDGVGELEDAEELANMEAYGHLLTAYRWLGRHFGKAYPDYAAASAAQNHIQAAIAASPAQRGLRQLCRSCGEELPLKSSFQECQACYGERQRRRERWLDEDKW